ncbi:MAG: hypothetical protein F6J98_02210 [Moorea sp. SIO4G2]|nr:hypothetical protein [Moorena sp. SIO4G2]
MASSRERYIGTQGAYQGDTITTYAGSAHASGSHYAHNTGEDLNYSFKKEEKGSVMFLETIRWLLKKAFSILATVAAAIGEFIRFAFVSKEAHLFYAVCLLIGLVVMSIDNFYYYLVDGPGLFPSPYPGDSWIGFKGDGMNGLLYYFSQVDWTMFVVGLILAGITNMLQTLCITFFYNPYLKNAHIAIIVAVIAIGILSYIAEFIIAFSQRNPLANGIDMLLGGWIVLLNLISVASISVGILFYLMNLARNQHKNA